MSDELREFIDREFDLLKQEFKSKFDQARTRFNKVYESLGIQ